jgi:hypothetical protein
MQEKLSPKVARGVPTLEWCRSVWLVEQYPNRSGSSTSVPLPALNDNRERFASPSCWTQAAHGSREFSVKMIHRPAEVPPWSSPAGAYR